MLHTGGGHIYLKIIAKDENSGAKFTMASYPHLLVFSKLMGKPDPVSFDDYIYIQIFMFQKYIPYETSNQVCFISQYVCHISRIL